MTRFAVGQGIEWVTMRTLPPFSSNARVFERQFINYVIYVLFLFSEIINYTHLYLGQFYNVHDSKKNMFTVYGFEMYFTQDHFFYFLIKK